MKKRCVAFTLALAGACAWGAAAETVADWGRLMDEAAVRKFVHPRDGSSAPKLLKPGVVELPCNFAAIEGTRTFWDFDLKLDLKRAQGLSFDFRCTDADAVTAYTIYLKSGAGWYTGNFVPEKENEFHRIVVDKSAFDRTEGKVAGWSQVTGLRIAAWKGLPHDARLAICNLETYGTTPDVVVVRGDSCALKDSKEDYTGFATLLSGLARQTGLSVTQVSDQELDAEALAQARLVVLPYNPSLPSGAIDVLKAYRARGGKLLVCYSLADGVAPLMGLKNVRFRSGQHEEALRSVEGVAKVGDGLAGQPAFMAQRSHNMHEVVPTGEGRIVGVWADKDGRPVGPAALVETPAGFYLSHVWMNGRADGRSLFRSLVGAVDATLGEKCAAAERTVRAREEADAAWVAAQPSKAGEWRAFWCHNEKGLGGKYSWDDSIRILKENGFNAILPNLAWGGLIFPTDDCLAACRKYGVECHIWKVCWRGKKGLEPKLRGGCQKSFDGKENPLWMCPSDPQNLAAEIEDFMKLARLKPTGIHFDYIRYPDKGHCFCDGCRTRFEAHLGRKVANWPKDVRADEALASAWRTFRCSNVTALVKGVAARVRRECPDVQLSAAVFSSVVGSPDSVGQAWPSWCREGILDFVCPMDYYMGSTLAFRGLVRSQAAVCAGSKTKLRPGLGLSCWKVRDHDARTMTEQIKVIRDFGLDGFTVFNYDARALGVLPDLHSGPTK